MASQLIFRPPLLMDTFDFPIIPISILSLTYPKTVIRDFFLWITDFQNEEKIETHIPRKWIHSSKVILSAYLKPAKRPFP